MFKKLITIATIATAVLVAVPASADHRQSHNNYYNNNSNYYNNGGNYNRWHQPQRRYNNNYRYDRRHGRNNDLAGIIIGGVILNELFRNNNRRRHVQQCHDVRNFYYDHYGNRVEYYERVCN
jgi:hypothetical protein